MVKVTQWGTMLAWSAVVLLAACTMPKDAAFMNRGGPESLLDVSSEVVTVNVATPGDVDALARWVEGDHPSRVELQCDVSAPHCKKAIKLLESKGIPLVTVPSAANTAMLVYERILARDCNQRFREPDSSSVYNAPSPALGCSIAANMVQHVSDKSVFINPSISDDPSAASGMNALRKLGASQNSSTIPAYSIQQSATTGQ